MNTLKNIVRLSALAALASVSFISINASGVSAATTEPGSGQQQYHKENYQPQQCHQHQSCCYKTVTRYKWVEQAYQVEVIRYKPCGTPYRTWVTKYKSVKVPYQVRVLVCGH